MRIYPQITQITQKGGEEFVIRISRSDGAKKVCGQPGSYLF
jgi:hypothetical protein